MAQRLVRRGVFQLANGVNGASASSGVFSARPAASIGGQRRYFASGVSSTPPDGLPKVVTDIPGPKSKEMLTKLYSVMQPTGIPFFVNLKESSGNYVVDADGNRFLDLFCQIASLPLGYNHPALVKAASSEEATFHLANRAALGKHPHLGYADDVKDALMKVAPKGMDEVITMMCGSCSNENTLKNVFMWYRAKERGDSTFTVEEEESCMMNKFPGSPKLSILSFVGGFHGRTMGVLSLTCSKPIHKIDIPTFDWPIAPFPTLKYPLDKHVTENRQEEQRCLKAVRSLIEEWHKKGNPVAGVIVEPIQSEGGDNHASPEFFRELRKITKEVGAAFIVDEVQTGVAATGNMWAFESWNLDDPPEFVTFAKKMQIGGYFLKSDCRPNAEMRIFNTWMGDAARMVITKAMLEVINEENLIQQAVVTGNVLVSGLEKLQDKYPSHLSRARGQGTFCAVDCPSEAKRKELITGLWKKGVHVQGCGDFAIRFRPSLTLTPQHVDIAMAAFDEVLATM